MKEQLEGARKWRAFEMCAIVAKTFPGPTFCPVATRSASTFSPESLAQLEECTAAPIHSPAAPPRAPGTNGQPPSLSPSPGAAAGRAGRMRSRKRRASVGDRRKGRPQYQWRGPMRCVSRMRPPPDGRGRPEILAAVLETFWQMQKRASLRPPWLRRTGGAVCFLLKARGRGCLGACLPSEYSGRGGSKTKKARREGQEEFLPEGEAGGGPQGGALGGCFFGRGILQI